MKRFILVFAMILGAYVGFAQSAAELLNSANEALSSKDYAKAFELYDSAMGDLGDVQVDDAINFNIGYAGYQSEQYEACIPYFDKAIEAGAQVVNSYMYKGEAYVKIKNYTDAITAYQAAIEAGSEDAGKLYYKSGSAAYNGKLYEQGAEFFGNAVDAGYNAETAMYNKTLCLKNLGNDEEYKQALIEGVEKFPAEEKLTSALAKIYVIEGNELYQKGAAIISAANEQVNAGTISTADEAYIAEIEKSKAEFTAAVEVLEKAAALDASNANATALLEACKGQL